MSNLIPKSLKFTKRKNGESMVTLYIPVHLTRIQYLELWDRMKAHGGTASLKEARHFLADMFTTGWDDWMKGDWRGDSENE